MIEQNVPPSEAHSTIHHTNRKKRVLLSLSQPLTAMQVAHKTGLSFDTCRDVMLELSRGGVLRCLNDNARRSRLYWLTRIGKRCQRQLFDAAEKMPLEHYLPDVDWTTYGSVCFSHRSIIIKILTNPMQPSEIKRKARGRYTDLRMSANNVRDIIRIFRSLEIVRPVRTGRKVHLRYELTDAGQQFQELLRRAEVPA